jgi:hypothetical protein
MLFVLLGLLLLQCFPQRAQQSHSSPQPSALVSSMTPWSDHILCQNRSQKSWDRCQTRPQLCLWAERWMPFARTMVAPPSPVSTGFLFQVSLPDILGTALWWSSSSLKLYLWTS